MTPLTVALVRAVTFLLWRACENRMAISPNHCGECEACTLRRKVERKAL